MVILRCLEFCCLQNSNAVIYTFNFYNTNDLLTFYYGLYNLQWWSKCGVKLINSAITLPVLALHRPVFLRIAMHGTWTVLLLRLCTLPDLSHCFASHFASASACTAQAFYQLFLGCGTRGTYSDFNNGAAYNSYLVGTTNAVNET